MKKKELQKEIEAASKDRERLIDLHQKISTLDKNDPECEEYRKLLLDYQGWENKDYESVSPGRIADRLFDIGELDDLDEIKLELELLRASLDVVSFFHAVKRRIKKTALQLSWGRHHFLMICCGFKSWSRIFNSILGDPQ